MTGNANMADAQGFRRAYYYADRNLAAYYATEAAGGQPLGVPCGVAFVGSDGVSFAHPARDLTNAVCLVMDDVSLIGWGGAWAVVATADGRLYSAHGSAGILTPFRFGASYPDVVEAAREACRQAGAMLA